ncbi:MAG: penicillin-binding protein activator LpoB [Endozoicomonadaceae bacterium]|nr:penicillin-binding protein activator LpoB [Endozoicomonadaceae bacterium]
MKRCLLILLIPLFFAGCVTEVKRLDLNEEVDLSGAWNDTDSRLVAETMVDDVLNRPWIDQYVRKKGKPPTVIVGRVDNLSHEHINTRTFVRDMERALINSGRVDFVASSAERGEVRDEREDQDLHSTETSRNAAGEEQGASFMLQGSIETIIDGNSNEQIRYYQVNLTLISLANNRKVWIGEKKIRKKITNSRLRY